MSNIDLTRIISPADKAAVATQARIALVKAECGTRIYAVADQIAQMNMTAAASAGSMTPAQMVTWQAALQWVGTMRATCLPLIADAETDYTVDAAWPVVPDGVAELAAQF